MTFADLIIMGIIITCLIKLYTWASEQLEEIIIVNREHDATISRTLANLDDYYKLLSKRKGKIYKLRHKDKVNFRTRNRIKFKHRKNNVNIKKHTNY